MQKNPYVECPVYETEHFRFRLVEMEDAEDLLACYADPKSAPIFNSDNCTSDFILDSTEQVEDMIKFWLAEYGEHGYIRFGIVDQSSAKAIGTIEMFSTKKEFAGYGTVGVLRLDLASDYERDELITEILAMIDDHFYEIFQVDSIITKAIPEARERIAALEGNGYQALANQALVPYDHYFLKSS